MYEGPLMIGDVVRSSLMDQIRRGEPNEALGLADEIRQAGQYRQIASGGFTPVNLGGVHARCIDEAMRNCEKAVDEVSHV